MKTEIWWLGKTTPSYLDTGIRMYQQRLQKFLPVEIVEFPLPKKGKKWTATQHCQAEAQLIHNKLQPQDRLILLDERGKMHDSKAFANYLQKQLQMSPSKLIFLIGGAYGFSDSLYQRADARLSLSAMTFSHQLIRLVFMEQLYRANTILNGHPYHNV